MGPGDALRLTVFLTLVGAVYVLAGRTLVARLVARRQGRIRPLTATGRWGERIVLGLAGLGVCAVTWGFLGEPRLLTVTRVPVPSGRVPAGSRPIRIVHLTDLHSEATPNLEERIPDAVAAERPDLVLFTGDALSTTAGLPVFRRCLSRVAAIAPTYASLGNWDVWIIPGVDRFSGTGVVLLDGAAARAVVRGQDVWLAGITPGEEADASRVLAGVPAGAPLVVLYHYPDPFVVPEADRARVDLMLAGHNHGGQVALPFFGAILTLSPHGKRFEHGLYQVGSMQLFVSRGLGFEGRAPPVRLFAPPEIAVLDLVPTHGASGGVR